MHSCFPSLIFYVWDSWVGPVAPQWSSCKDISRESNIFITPVSLSEPPRRPLPLTLPCFWWAHLFPFILSPPSYHFTWLALSIQACDWWTSVPSWLLVFQLSAPSCSSVVMLQSSELTLSIVVKKKFSDSPLQTALTHSTVLKHSILNDCDSHCRFTWNLPWLFLFFNLRFQSYDLIS